MGDLISFTSHQTLRMDSFLKAPIRWTINQLGKKYDGYFPDSPVFIGGCGRSGTTILLSVLSAHHKLFCHPKELGLFNEKQTVEMDGKKNLSRKHRLYQSFLFNSIPKTATRWVEKSPSNIRHIEKISTYTDGVFKFIHIIRDGRDVILSRHPTAPDRYWVEPKRWIHDVTAGLKWMDDPRVLTIKYEDLLSNYEVTIKSICDHLEIETTPEILQWHQHARVTENRAFSSKVQPLTTSSIGKWRDPKNAKRVAELTDKPEAVALLTQLGYEV
jgi:hypothetical protein